MKKTLIAAAVAAVVAAPAFADVKVSGQVHQQFAKTDGSRTAENSENGIYFNASEDLGNGLTAFAHIGLDVDGTAETGKDQKIGLKGSFGTVVFGQMEDFTEGKVQSRVTLTSDTSGSGAILESNTDNGRTDGAMAYVSPTMNGLHFGIATYTDVGVNSSGADAYDLAVFYDNGPLSIAVARELVKGALGAEDEKVLSAAISYSMDNLKLTALRTSTDNNGGTAANDQDDMSYKLDYKMGANTLTLGYKDDENATGGNGTDTWVVEAVHNFSKQTSVYGAYIDYDDTTTVDKAVKVGLKHKF